MNKRGFIKTLEAVLAILIVFIFMYSMSQRENAEDSNTKVMKNIQEGLLKGISQNEDFRNCIVATSTTAEFSAIATGTLCPDVKRYVEDTLPDRFVSKKRYAIGVCNAGDCNLLTPANAGKYVYTSAVVISSDLKEQRYDPKIFRIWMW